MRTRGLGLIAAASVLACSPPARGEVAPPSTQVVPPRPGMDSVLRGVNWCNRPYGDRRPTLSACRGEVEQRHRAGEGIWAVEKYHLTSVTYGELTGDGREDALLVFEVTLQTILIGSRPPNVRFEAWVIERRGTDLVLYTTEGAESPPASVSIANGTVTLVWRHGGTSCDEHWRFAGEGEAAVKTARSCRRTVEP